MNSEKSVQSIKTTDKLFPVDILEDVSLIENETREGEDFLAACKSGDTEHVLKCLDVYNTSVLNKISGRIDKTGLHWACENKNIGVVKVLTQHPSINVNVRDKDGDNALDYCRQRHYTLFPRGAFSNKQKFRFGL